MCIVGMEVIYTSPGGEQVRVSASDGGIVFFKYMQT